MKAPKSITVANRLHRPHQRGAGLVEVLVAIIVFSIGVIGMVRMQAQALKNAESAYLRTQANMLGYYMLDALRIDRIRARDGLYNLNKICTIPPAGSSLIAYQHQQWLQAIKTSLGNHNGTCGEITCSSTDCRVRVYWDDSRGTDGTSNTMVELRSPL